MSIVDRVSIIIIIFFSPHAKPVNVISWAGGADRTGNDRVVVAKNRNFHKMATDSVLMRHRTISIAKTQKRGIMEYIMSVYQKLVWNMCFLFKGKKKNLHFLTPPPLNKFKRSGFWGVGGLEILLKPLSALANDITLNTDDVCLKLLKTSC